MEPQFDKDGNPTGSASGGEINARAQDTQSQFDTRRQEAIEAGNVQREISPASNKTSNKGFLAGVGDFFKNLRKG